MKRKYFFRHFIVTPNSLISREEKESKKLMSWKFNFKDAEVLVYNSELGLFTDCYVEADSSGSAELEALTYTENIVSIIDFTTLSASSPAHLIIAYDASENIIKREFKQIRYIPILERNIKKIEINIFDDIFTCLDKNLEPKIIRSIYWLRKALLEEKHIDIFIALWTGLESISEPLCDYYSIPKEERVFKCPNSDCNHIFFDSYIKGAKKLFQEVIKKDKVSFDEIRYIRNGISHGSIQLDDKFLSKIKVYNPLLKITLIKGVGKIIPLKDKTLRGIIQQKPKKFTEKIRVVLKTKLINFNPPEIENAKKQPYLDVKDKLYGREIDDKFKIHWKYNFVAKKCNAGFDEELITEFVVDENTSIEKVESVNKENPSCHKL